GAMEHRAKTKRNQELAEQLLKELPHETTSIANLVQRNNRDLDYNLEQLVRTLLQMEKEGTHVTESLINTLMETDTLTPKEQALIWPAYNLVRQMMHHAALHHI
uniref:Protein C n=1 Tax=Tupaia paramyxovirus TaxID=92129 RepID=UPI0027E5BE29|nr:Chain A, Protein C [Tupaia paramyxovirus]8BJW_B Chain B, Protein C [Tupaia paramyxovirus]8BJW_C Chain C, Protein C [Tupaia paramyxovirus]8BJW_D Chain D, Protein C [Tupaia paramyxovirus]8BJW_E Chain E, Protein C [Tupaia paramyxovirus]8BJW_F Chain F, Protein C [Tupaia paramyxovirus]